jgi:catechol 2,3-dioxygenase-like lactoylglutathione lyase family enzyme
VLGAIDQIGHVTGDLDAAVAMWTSHLGVGPWTVYRNVRLTGDYRGSPAEVTIDVALAYQGGIQIELIEPTSSAPSPYRDSAGALREGVHHIAWVVDNLAAAMDDFARRGLSPVFRAGNPASEVAYFEPAPGVVWELIEGKGMRAMIAAGLAAAEAWDGSNPVTEIDLRG